MSSVRFQLQPCDAGYFATAPERYVQVFELPRSRDAVWADLTRDGTLDWCRLISRVAWTSPGPFGVGTTRRVRALGALLLEERYFTWTDGQQKSFHATRASLPLFRRFAEDYLLEDVDGDRCRLTWTIAIEPLPAARLGAPVNRLIARSLFSDTRRHFAAASGR
jgi:hypothetical protein